MQKKKIILDLLYASIIYIANDKSREIKVCIILDALSFSAIHTFSPILISFQTILNHILLFPYSDVWHTCSRMMHPDEKTHEPIQPSWSQNQIHAY
jgi:hypothetical protein